MARLAILRQRANGTLRNGERLAFEDHYEEWSDSVYRYLRHYVGSASAAEDLFQETWTRALEHREQLKREDRFGPWILRIARNRALNHLRRRRYKVQVWILSNLASSDGAGGEDLLDRRASADPTPRESAVRAESRQILHEAMEELDLPSQEMLQLRYFQGLTLAEVAEVLGMPLGTVCTKVHRALKIIRERLKLQGFRELRDLL